MSTFNGSVVPFCSVQQFITRYDVRSLGDFLNDEGQRYTKVDILTVGSPPYSILYSLLQESAGEIEAACLRGTRYSIADLNTLQGNSQALLIGLNADITVPKVYDRRPDLEMPLPKRVERALAVLAELENGGLVFSLQEVEQAGLPEAIVEDPSVRRGRRLTTQILGRFFGRRAFDERQST